MGTCAIFVYGCVCVYVRKFVNSCVRVCVRARARARVHANITCVNVIGDVLWFRFDWGILISAEICKPA